MAALEFETRRSGCYLGETASLNIVNREIKIPQGNGKLFPGQVLAQADGADADTYVPHAPAAADGSQNASAILFHPVDTADADVKTVATTNGPATVNGHELTYADGITDAQKAAAENALREKGMAVLPQHAG